MAPLILNLRLDVTVNFTSPTSKRLAPAPESGRPVCSSHFADCVSSVSDFEAEGSFTPVQTSQFVPVYIHSDSPSPYI